MKSLRPKRSTRLLWWGIGSISLLTTMLMIFGFIYAVQTVLFPTVAHETESDLDHVESPQEDGEQREGIHIVTLGDSLSKGTGDPSGKGYTGVVQEMLEEQAGEKVYVVPYAVNGYRTDQLITLLQDQKGVRATIKQADIVLFTIGANDLFQVGREVDPDRMLENLQGTVGRIDQIFSLLAGLNSEAQLIYSALYNPFTAIDPEGEASRFVHQFNQEVATLAIQYPNIAVVPTFDLFHQDTEKYLSSDYFHPNTLGYERIASRVLQLIRWEDSL